MSVFQTTQLSPAPSNFTSRYTFYVAENGHPVRFDMFGAHSHTPLDFVWHCSDTVQVVTSSGAPTRIFTHLSLNRTWCAPFPLLLSACLIIF